MRLFLAIFLPFLAFFTIGRPFAGLICFFLQMTLIGWVTASFWAIYALAEWETDRKIRDHERRYGYHSHYYPYGR